MSKLTTLTDAEFEANVLKAQKPTLVDFWAEWCAPCRALSPIVEDVAEAHAASLQVGKMNIDENPTTPGKFGVRAIPTLVLFKGGNAVDQLVGLVNKAKIEEMLAKHLG
jgi:thioredoxin 1